MNIGKRIALFIECIRVAFRSLVAHRLRTLLTMLGVAIGIFAITIIFTLVNSLNYNLSRNIAELGNTVLFVTHIPWSTEGLNWQKYVRRPKVSYSDYRKLKDNLELVDGVAYEVRLRNGTVKYDDESVEGVNIRAVTEDYIHVHSLEFAAGRAITAIEVDAGRPVCLVGANVAEKLFGKARAVGKNIRIRGKKVRVVGVMAQAGSNMFGNSHDDMVLLPYGFANRIYHLNRRRLDKFAMVRVRGVENIPRVESRMVGLLRSSRGLRPRTENNFEINRPEMLENLFGDALVYLRWGGAIISIFSIFVGGFGIGNIMFTTVKERTFEIGLQKALGATRGFILLQFLTESIMLCLLGGIFGLLLNFGVTALMQAVLHQMAIDFEMVISFGNIVFGVVLSVVIGLLSGYFPSAIASRMDPVESMRA